MSEVGAGVPSASTVTTPADVHGTSWMVNSGQWLGTSGEPGAGCRHACPEPRQKHAACCPGGRSPAEVQPAMSGRASSAWVELQPRGRTGRPTAPPPRRAHGLRGQLWGKVHPDHGVSVTHDLQDGGEGRTRSGRTPDSSTHMKTRKGSKQHSTT